MKIVLIGYRGTGKSAIGKILAARYSIEYLSMDDEIVRRAGVSISQIVERHGWDHFRELETTLARELSNRSDLLIDTGGGVIERDENMVHLQRDAVVVWLRASVDTIIDRISLSTDRPALVEGKTFTQEVSEVLARRTPKYEAAAQVNIDTDGRAIEDIVELIIEAIAEI